jgi:hypothetical protein
MGMESFFVIILPNGISHKNGQNSVNIYDGSSDLSLEKFKYILSNIPYISHIINENEINIENKYLMKIVQEENKVKTIEVESCLYYLMNDDEILKELLLYMNQLDLKLFHPGIGYFEGVTDYLLNLKIFYKDKYNNYLYKYEYLFKDKNILPGNDFYKNIK